MLTTLSPIPLDIPAALHGVFMEGVRAGRTNSRVNRYNGEVKRLENLVALTTGKPSIVMNAAALGEAKRKQKIFARGFAEGVKTRTQLKGGLGV